jgi:hypothetical protein
VRRMSLLLGTFRTSDCRCEMSVVGAKRTSKRPVATSDFDPKRTLARPACRHIASEVC